MVEQAAFLQQGLQLPEDHDVRLSMEALLLQQAFEAFRCCPQERHRPAPHTAISTSRTLSFRQHQIRRRISIFARTLRKELGGPHTKHIPLLV